MDFRWIVDSFGCLFPKKTLLLLSNQTTDSLQISAPSFLQTNEYYMRIAFLFFLFSSIAYDQVPVVTTYSDFLTSVQAGQATALSLSEESYQYGVPVNNLIYQEVLPINDEYQFLFSEIYENRVDAKIIQNDDFPKGDSYVCLCKTKDLVGILKRWKDGQSSIQDYAKFDCKHKSFYEKDKLYKGQSFWAEKNLLESLIKEDNNIEHISLSENVKAIVFKNRGDQSKKIIKIGFDVPVQEVIKVVEDETYLTSVKTATGEEVYMKGFSAHGWKSLFPDWKAYRPLNTGLWGEPKIQSPIKDGYFSKSYSISSTNAKSFSIQGRTTFLVKDDSKKEKRMNLQLGEQQRVIKKEAYLDYGSELTYGVVGMDNESKQMIVSFNSEIPLSKIIILDEKGIEIGQADAHPFEVLVPTHTTHIQVKIEYFSLKKIQVDYQVD